MNLTQTGRTLALFTLLLSLPIHAGTPVVIALDAEFGLPGSTSAQSIELGMRIAIDEINDSGGVLGGRPLALELTDNRSVPARGEENLKKLADNSDGLVAVVGGRFSPVYLHLLPLIHQIAIPYFDAWGSADGITSHPFTPSYTFRVSMRDSDAMPVLIDHLRGRGANAIALVIPESGWGRSNLAAARAHTTDSSDISISAVERYPYGERSFSDYYDRILASGANGLVLVANEIEGALLVNEIASRPVADRLPIASHWGVTGGEFYPRCADGLKRVDFSVIQTFSLQQLAEERRVRLMEQIEEITGNGEVGSVDSVVGVGHGHDIVQLIAIGLEISGSDSPPALRDALEKIGDYRGLVRHYHSPFTPSDHDALAREDLFMARFDQDGRLIPQTNR